MIKKYFIALVFLSVLISCPLPVQATNTPPRFPPEKCWDSLAKITMEFGHSGTDKIRYYNNPISYFEWAVMNCRKNDFNSVVKAYSSQYRNLADYDYYGVPATILKGYDANAFRVWVCNTVKKSLRQNNSHLNYPNLACK